MIAFLILFCFSDMKQLQSQRVASVKQVPRHYYLLYFYEEKSYSIVPAISTMFTSSVDHHAIKQNILLRNNVAAKVMLISNSKQDLEVAHDRLEARLDESKSFDARKSSLGFLCDNASCDDDEVCEPSEEQTRCGTSQRSNSQSINPVEHDNSTDEEIVEERIQAETSIMNEVLKQLKRCNKLQHQHLNEQVKCRKILTKLLKRSPGGTEDNHTVSPDPVIYNGVDLTSLGPNRLDVSNFSLLVARKLWKDEELMKNRLFPKRNTSRGSLSPNRSKTFESAIRSRFRCADDDDDDLRVAINAVNQLGSDIKSGKRRRTII